MSLLSRIATMFKRTKKPALSFRDRQVMFYKIRHDALPRSEQVIQTDDIAQTALNTAITQQQQMILDQTFNFPVQ